MTDGVTATLAVRLSATDSKAPPVGGAVQSVNEVFQMALAAGAAVGKADKMLTKAINIAASGNTTINLTTALDAFGVAAAILDVQAVLLIADPTNTNNIVVGNGTNPWVGPFGAGTDTVSVKPGGVLLLADPSGWPVVASTGDVLKLANSSSGSAVTGQLVIIGRSA